MPPITRTAAALVMLAAHAVALAQADQPWLDPTSSVRTSPVEAWCAALGAIVFALLSLRAERNLETAIVAAFAGAMLGALIGWPMSCMAR